MTGEATSGRPNGAGARMASAARMANVETMKAVAIDRFGPPEVLQLHTMPVPRIKASQVLIRVDTAGVGNWETSIRDGSWAENKTFPQILGTEGSGVVVATGSRVTRFKEGDRVIGFAFPEGGFYAEYVALGASKIAPAPKSLDLRDAGALTIIGLTALQG